MVGLSIRYALATTESDTQAVRKLVEEMRRLALALSFERVGPVIEIIKKVEEATATAAGTTGK